jgi:hypothetical protein
MFKKKWDILCKDIRISDHVVLIFFFMYRFTFLEKLVISYLRLFLSSHTYCLFRLSSLSLLLGLCLFNRPPYPLFTSSFEPPSFNLNGVSTYRGCGSLYIWYWLICWNSLKINDIYHTSQLSYLWGHAHKDISSATSVRYPMSLQSLPSNNMSFIQSPNPVHNLWKHLLLQSVYRSGR